MKINNETKIGILTILSVTILILGFNYLKGKDVFSNTVSIYAEYDKISGLKVANPVLYNGFMVGKVTKLSLSEEGTIIATLTVIPDAKIPNNSLAKISSQDLLGSMAIELEYGDSRTFLEDGDTINTGLEMSLKEALNSEVMPVKVKAEKLLGTIDSILISLQYVLNPDFRNNIDQSFASIRRSIETLEKTTNRVDSMVKFQSTKFRNITTNVESITNNLKNNNERINNILENLSQISDSVSKINFIETVNKANRTLDEVAIITDKINNGKGSIGLLINDDKLYTNLTKSSLDLDKLLVDVRLNPRRYVNVSVFGGRGNKKYKEPEADSVQKK